MARTPSNMLALGTKAPNFRLYDTASHRMLTLAELKGKAGTVVMFICNHCPFVIHVNEQLVKTANEYQAKGIQFIAISSNDVVNYPQDSPEKMIEQVKKLNYPFPYLYDETQQVAKSYDAACTPDLYLFNENLELVYRGQLDGSRPGNDIPVTGEDLHYAMDCLLSGKENDRSQMPSIGCN
ncbi:MAG: thioredoxin family protein, partial [Bacteroidia bacterium]|nr:thioredoxin family protein [Bacteroidia bacterium]